MSSYKQMLFKNQRVFVDVDEKGRPVLTDGRATMRYKPGDERVYHPSIRNLREMGGETLEPEKGAVSSRPELTLRDTSFGKDSQAAFEGESADDQVIAYTDGACLGNPGPAGLGYSVRFPDGSHRRLGEPLGRATNNIAELTAVLRVLELIDTPGCSVVIHTDSSYAIGVLTKGWRAKANQELIAQIKRRLAKLPGVTLRKVKGHAGVPENELVDGLARTAAETQKIVR